MKEIEKNHTESWNKVKSSLCNSNSTIPFESPAAKIGNLIDLHLISAPIAYVMLKVVGEYPYAG